MGQIYSYAQGYCLDVIQNTNQPNWGYTIAAVCVSLVFAVLPFLLLVPLNHYCLRWLQNIQYLLKTCIGIFDFDVNISPKQLQFRLDNKEEIILDTKQKEIDLQIDVKTIGGYFTLVLISMMVFLIWFVVFVHYSGAMEKILTTSSPVFHPPHLKQQFEITFPQACDGIQIIPQGVEMKDFTAEYLKGFPYFFANPIKSWKDVE